MALGNLRMWNADRGFGFIADDAGGAVTFLHTTELQAAGIVAQDIRTGDRLEFDVEKGRDGKVKATNVRRTS